MQVESRVLANVMVDVLKRHDLLYLHRVLVTQGDRKTAIQPSYLRLGPLRSATRARPSIFCGRPFAGKDVFLSS